MKSVDIESNDILLCPECGELHLHHYEVEHLIMRREDVPLKTVVVRANGTRREWPAHPSDYGGRRGAVRIHFVCECCTAMPVLQLMQHKGRTHVEWLQSVDPA